MSNTTPKTEQELANESFDKRMKKEAYKGRNPTDIRTMFGLAVKKYSINSLKFKPEYLLQLLNTNPMKFTMYDIGVMLNIIRGAAFEFLGCSNEFEALERWSLIDAEYRSFNEVAEQCWKAAEKEAASKTKFAMKVVK